MKLKYNKNVNELIDQATKNLDEMFNLFKTVQKQVNTLSNLVIDETADSGKRVAKELVNAGDELTGEAMRVVHDCIDDSVKTAFPEEVKKEAKKEAKKEVKSDPKK